MPKPSTATRIASALLVIGGLLNITTGALALLAPSDPTIANSAVSMEATLKDLVAQIVDILTILSAIINFILAWFLLKQKKWAYVVSMIFVSLALLLHLSALAEMEATRYAGFALTIAIFILLIIGKKDFFVISH